MFKDSFFRRFFKTQTEGLKVRRRLTHPTYSEINWFASPSASQIPMEMGRRLFDIQNNVHLLELIQIIATYRNTYRNDSLIRITNQF